MYDEIHEPKADAGKNLNQMSIVIATGGLASLYAKACPSIEHVEPDLTIYGLKELFEMNK